MAPLYVDPWVSALAESKIERARQIIGRALDVSGFDRIRVHIFGADSVASAAGRTYAGLPHCAGYAIGYQVVQASLQRTGRSAIEATFVPYTEIIEESKVFQ